MLLDTKEILKFSDTFHNEGRALGVHIVKKRLSNDAGLYMIFDIEELRLFAAFACFRDAQSYCAMKGFTIKDTRDDDATPRTTSPK